MTSYLWISVIALVGSLVLVVSGLQARDLGWRRGLLMAAAWMAIFFVASAVLATAQG